MFWPLFKLLSCLLKEKNRGKRGIPALGIKENGGKKNWTSDLIYFHMIPRVLFHVLFLGLLLINISCRSHYIVIYASF